MSVDREITCIVCPQGCRITVKGDAGDLVIEGNRCPRGLEYAKKEVTAPERTITSSVKVTCGELPLVSVKTTGTVPKKRIRELMEEIKAAETDAPVDIGDVLVEDLGGTGVKVVATKRVGEK